MRPLSDPAKYSIITALYGRRSLSDNIKAKLPLCGRGLLCTSIIPFGMSQTKGYFEATLCSCSQDSADVGVACSVS